jgi:hypothetical protein
MIFCQLKKKLHKILDNLEYYSSPLNLPQYVFEHVSTMAKLHAKNRYDRLTSAQKLTGKPSMSVREYVTAHPEVFSIAANSSQMIKRVVHIDYTDLKNLHLPNIRQVRHRLFQQLSYYYETPSTIPSPNSTCY